MEKASAPIWWRNPTIIAAIVGAAAVIIAALIALVPKSKPADTQPQTTIIKQQTSGSGSPAVGQTGGNVTNTIEQPGPAKK